MDNSSLAHPEFEVTTTVSPRGSRNQDSTIVHKSLTFDPLPIQKCEFVLFNVIGWFMVLFIKKSPIDCSQSMVCLVNFVLSGSVPLVHCKSCQTLFSGMFNLRLVL